MNNFQNNNFDDPFGSNPGNGFSSGGSQNNGFGPSQFSNPFGDDSVAPPPSTRRYGLHWLQTLVVLAITAGVSFVLMHTLDIRYAANPTINPNLVPFNGLFFALLAAAILLTIFFLELITSAMTPHFSRKLQLLVAVIAIALCGLTGALSEMFFVNNYVAPQLLPTPTPVVTPIPTATPTPTPSPTPTPVPVVNDEAIIFALDKSASMSGSRDIESVKALNTVIQKMSPNSHVGMIVFCHEILSTVPLAPNTSAQRSALSAAASISTTGATEFPTVVETALEMVKRATLPSNTDVKLVFLTDGSGGSTDRYLTSCKSLNMQVSCVAIGDFYPNDLNKVISGTGGITVTAKNPEDILNMTQSIVSRATPAPTPTLKPTPTPFMATPSPTPLPKIGNMSYVTPDSDFYLAATFIFVGLILGVSMTLMLSLQGQFRLQLLLSPVMGLCAFLLIRSGYVSSSEYWMVYLLFGLVLMRRNAAFFSGSASTHQTARSSQQPLSDNDWNF